MTTETHEEPLYVDGRDGYRYLARNTDSRLTEKLYANRTQAETAAVRWGGIVIRGAVYGPFRVRLPLSDGRFS